MPQYLTDLFGATEFIAALIGALVGGSATFLAEVYTSRQSAKQGDEGWRREKRTKALEECYEILATMHLLMDHENTDFLRDLRKSAELVTARFHIRLYAQDVDDVVTYACTAFDQYLEKTPKYDVRGRSGRPETEDSAHIKREITNVLQDFEAVIRATPDAPKPNRLARLATSIFK